MARDPLALLEVRDLTVGRADRPILRDVSLELHRGEIGVLLGGNGAGKSTLLRTVAGLELPACGTVWHAGTQVTGFDPASTALLLEDPVSQFVADTAQGELEFAAQCRGVDSPRERAVAGLAAAGLSHLAHRVPGTLSGGEQQALLLAAAAVFEPELMLLDDPFVFLGEREAWAAWDRVRDQLRNGRLGAVLLATHDPNLAAEADQVGLLGGGELLAWDAPETVLRGSLPPAVGSPWAFRVEDLFARAGRPLPPGGLSAEGLAARLARAASC